MIRNVAAVVSVFGSLWCVIPGLSAQSADWAQVLGKIEGFRRGEARPVRMVFERTALTVYASKEESVDGQTEVQDLLIPPIRLGSKGVDTRRLQIALRSAGFFSGEVTGVFDDATLSAVKKFQQSAQLGVDGVVGPDTWSKLFGKSPRAANLIAPPEIRDGRDGFTHVVYPVDWLLELEEISPRQPSTSPDVPPGEERRWIRRSYVPLGTFPSANLASFLEECARRGLTGIEIGGRDEKKVVWLTFRRPQPHTIRAGGKALKLSDELSDSLRVSPRFGFRQAASTRFVVFVHDPHWNVEEQFQILTGLKTLLLDNDEFNFRFLVEGKRWTESREIPIEPIDGALAPRGSLSRFVQVHQALRDFLIDAPFAYRLLYDALPALAIDDQELLEKAPGGSLLPDLSDVFTALEVLGGTLEERQGPRFEIPREAVKHAYLETMVFAQKIAQLEGENFSSWLGFLTDVFEDLQLLLADLPADEFGEFQSFFTEIHARFATEMEESRLARQREVTMARLITEQLETRQTEIPIVVIGDFHTSGLLERLPEETGYLVLEPRTPTPGTADQKSRFSHAVSDYRGYLSDLFPAREKTPVAPHSDLARHLRGDFDRQLAADLAGFPSPDAARLISESVYRNGSFGEARIRAEKPPAGFSRAFASFLLEERHPEILIHPSGGPESERVPWSKARLDFLRRVHVASALWRDGPSLSLHRQSDRVFGVLSDPETKRHYFFEANSCKELLEQIPWDFEGAFGRLKLSAIGVEENAFFA